MTFEEEMLILMSLVAHILSKKPPFPNVSVKEKIIPTLVKMVKETLFKTIAIGERSDSTPNTTKTSGHLLVNVQSEGSVGGKLLTGDIKSTGVLF